jgi:hypothetical protein
MNKTLDGFRKVQIQQTLALKYFEFMLLICLILYFGKTLFYSFSLFWLVYSVFPFVSGWKKDNKTLIFLISLSFCVYINSIFYVTFL